jgi:hypothetical protein
MEYFIIIKRYGTIWNNEFEIDTEYSADATDLQVLANRSQTMVPWPSANTQ